MADGRVVDDDLRAAIAYDATGRITGHHRTVDDDVVADGNRNAVGIVLRTHVIEHHDAGSAVVTDDRVGDEQFGLPAGATINDSLLRRVRDDNFFKGDHGRRDDI